MSESERTWIVDRIEGEVAVLVADDDQETLDMPLDVLPRGVREGVEELTRGSGTVLKA